MNRCAVSFLGLFLFCAVPVWARSADDTNNLYTGPRWALLDESAEIAAARGITLSNYPNSDSATVDKKLVRFFRPDGTGGCQDEAFIKVLTEKGKRASRTISLYFTRPYSVQSMVKLEVIKPDGTIVPVDVAANSKETIDDSQMQMNIYDPNSLILQVNLPKVEIGDIVHSVARQTLTRSYMPGQFADDNVFEDEDYIRHASYEVYSPSQRPIVHKVLRDEVKGTVHYTEKKEADGATLHRWEFASVPRMFSEPAMPPVDMVLQRVLVTTTPTWEDVSKWYADLSQSHLQATTADMTNKVNELVAGTRGDMERMKAIFYFVSSKVRYMGLTEEKDRPGFEPHDVCLTFDKKYGVCRDKAALLVSLLRVAGLKSYPVLINVGTKMDPEVPDPFFNHAIVCVQTGRGKYVLMDPTDEHTRELLPTSDCDQSYLVCRPEGEKLRVSAIEPPEENMLNIKTSGTLSAGGALRAKSELYFGGVNDDDYRNFFSHLKADDLRRFFERNLKNALPGARLISFELWPKDMMDVSIPIRAEMDFSADGLTASGGGKTMVTLPWVGKHFGIVNFIIGETGLDKRKYPMRTSVACGTQEKISLRLDDGFTSLVSVPTCPPINDDCISSTEKVTYAKNDLECARDLKLKVVEFSPKQYLQLKKTLKSTEYDERKVPILAISPLANSKTETPAAGKAPAVESSAKILEASVTLDATDAHNAVEHFHSVKQIMNYAGKIREAEVKIYYNPSCEDAHLDRATVISKTGERVEIATNEMNIMDEGWNSSAKRYTGGKILVANLPGVDIGSTIDVEYTITNRGKPFLAGFQPFQFADTLNRGLFSLSASNGSGLILTRATGQPGWMQETATTNGAMVRRQWSVTNVAAVPSEGQTPPSWAFQAGVAYFVGEPKAYLQALDDTMLDRSRHSTNVAALTRHLMDGVTDNREKIKLIRDFVAKSIRLAGPDFADVPLRELSAADVTLNDGYGHGADRAILLHAMLTAAGFQPKFVLGSGLPSISGITNFSSSFPLPDYFSIPLVQVESGGTNYLLNDTDQYAELGSTSQDHREALILPDPTPVVLHPTVNCENKADTTFKMDMSDSGRTRITITRDYYGTYFAGKNHYFSELTPEERHRHFEEAVSDVAQGARAVGDLKTDFAHYPGREEFTVDVDNYAVVDGKYFYFDLPFAASLFGPGADQRTLPFYVTRRDLNKIKVEVALPPRFRHEMIAPSSRDLTVPDGGGDARITSTPEADGKFLVTYNMDTRPAIVQPHEYPALLEMESDLERKSSRAFLFSSAAPSSVR